MVMRWMSIAISERLNVGRITPIEPWRHAAMIFPGTRLA